VSTAETPAPNNPLTLNVLNRQGDAVGTVQIDPAEFGGEVRRQLLHEVVVMFLANQRAGTHSTKRRGEVAGSTKKLFRQKGTGNARAGTRRTNKRRGGGTAKGPKPRDYEYHLPKKAVRAATRMAILSKFLDGEAVILDELSLGEVKTKQVAELIKALVKGMKLNELPVPRQEGEELTPEQEATRRKRRARRMTWLIGTATPPLADADADEQKKAEAAAAREGHERLWRSARNIPGVRLMPASQFNAYTVLRQKRLVLTRAALEELRRAGQKKPAEAPAAGQ
jgi:large subunit ribosomal protein L4